MPGGHSGYPSHATTAAYGLAKGSASNEVRNLNGSAGLYVNAGSIQYHPGFPQAWAIVDQSGTQSIVSSYGVSSITDQGVGITKVNLSRALTTAGFCVCQNMGESTSNGVIIGTSAPADATTSAFTFRCRAANGGDYNDRTMGAIYYGLA